MTITNGYATLDQFRNLKEIRIHEADALDDSVIEDMIEQASRLIDSVCGRHFYSYSQTRYFDTPAGRELYVDEDLLSITTITNGNDVALPSTEYQLLPLNRSPKNCIRIKATSSYGWEMDSAGGIEGVIDIAGTWGFVSRSSTDPEGDRAIKATEFASLQICLMWYSERFGKNTGGEVIITAGGVVETPAGAIPRAAYEAIRPYIKRF